MEKNPVRIVVLQRGWIVVGLYSEVGNEIVVTSASIIRRWGTTRGLGELADSGPLKQTILDKAGTVRAHKLTVVLTLDCEALKWISVLP